MHYIARTVTARYVSASVMYVSTSAHVLSEARILRLYSLRSEFDCVMLVATKSRQQHTHERSLYADNVKMRETLKILREFELGVRSSCAAGRSSFNQYVRRSSRQ